MNMWFNACHAEDGDRRPGIGHFPWPRAIDGMYEDDEISPPRLNDPEIFEKHYAKYADNKEKLTLLSDNPLYEPYQVNSQDIVEVWKAVYIIQKAGSQPMWDVDQLAGVVNSLQDKISNLRRTMN